MLSFDMAFTTDEINSIISEFLIGTKKTIKGKEADEFRKEVIEDLKRIKSDGHEVSMIKE